VLSYSFPERLRSERAQRVRAISTEIVASRGEPWVSHYSPDEIEALVREAGITSVEHVSGEQAKALFAGRADGLKPDGVERLVVAST
jgi:O-methyltransferase involved in polyketide biosynthesis